MLALWQAPSGALALTIDGDVAWRSEPSDEGGWSLLSDDTTQIHAVLQNTGIFDQLVSTLSERLSKQTGQPKVWLPDVGFVPLNWLIRNYRGEE